MHGVQIVDKALHRLIGVAVCFALGTVSCHLNQSCCLWLGNLIMAAQALYNRCIEFLCSNLQARTAAGLLLCFLQHLCNRLLFILGVQVVLNTFHQFVGVCLFKGLFYTQRHSVIKVRDALSAVLVVLVGLDGDGCQCRIALDALWLTQKAVSSRKAAVKQIDNVDLGTGGGQRIKVKVMDVDVALAVGFCLCRCQQVGFVVSLGACGTNLQHTAHCGVAVDIGVVTLNVALAGIHTGDFVDGLHQAGVCLSDAGAVCAIEDILLCHLVKAHAHQLMLNNILNLLDFRWGIGIMLLQISDNCLCHRCGALRSRLTGCLHRFFHRCKNLAAVEVDDTPISFDNFVNHLDSPLIFILSH